jgi:glutathione S-transferase
MYTLFARSGSGSMIVEALLEEAGADYRIEKVERGTAGPEGFSRISPLGQVPALLLPDGTAMTESAAIAIHLADLHPELRLAPLQGSAKRPRYLRWMIFLGTNIYMTELRFYYAARYSTDPAHEEAVKSAALSRMAMEWEIFAAALGDGPYILGAEISAVDIYAAMLATWNLDLPAFFRKHPNVRSIYDRVTARPAVAKVWQRNEMESAGVQAASA